MPRLPLWRLVPFALVAAGCGAEPPAAATTPPAAPGKPAEFRPGGCGRISGSVTWDGAIPAVPPVVDVRPRPDGGGYDTQTLTHPYVPHIDPVTHALAGAVVYLRGVDPARAKPWDLPPVSAEFRDAQIVVTQGDRPPGRVGFVRRGEPVTMQSREPTFNVLRGRGAAFFALPFPDPDRPLERAFDTDGRIELTNAAGYYWQAADLFVCDHPYYAVSDTAGMFSLTQVPEGQYELVVWHPNWKTIARERNPETGLVQRVVYAPPLERARPVAVAAGRASMANPTLTPPK